MRMATMAKDQADKGPPSDDAVTTVKCRQRVARLIRKYAALLEVNQEEVLDRYANAIEEDLLAEMARQQGQLGNKKAGPKS